MTGPKLIRFSYRILLVFSIIIFIFILYKTYGVYVEKYETGAALRHRLFYYITGLLIGGLLIRKYTQSKYIPCLLLTAFFVRLLWIICIPTQAVSDFGFILQKAIELAGGKTEAVHHAYYYKYPYNLPFTLYEALVYKITGSVAALKILNVLFSTYIVWLIYAITGKILNKTAALYALLFALFFPPFIYHTSILSNQIITLSFILTGIYIYLTRHNLIVTGILFRIANLFRPIAIVFVFGLWLYILLSCSTKHNIFSKKNLKEVAQKSIRLWGSYYAVILSVFLLINASGLPVKSMFYDPIPHYKFLVGLNHQSLGRYNKEDAELTKTATDFKTEADQKIKERLRDKRALKILFDKKIELFWGHKNLDIYWTTRGLKNYDNLTKNIEILTIILYLMLLFFAIVYLISLLVQPALELNFTYYLLLLFILFFIIYLFIEIQARYRFSIYFIFIILSGGGLSQALNYIIQLKKYLSAKILN